MFLACSYDDEFDGRSSRAGDASCSSGSEPEFAGLVV